MWVLKLDEEKGGGRRERGTSIFRNLSVSNMRMLREEKTRIGYKHGAGMRPGENENRWDENKSV